MKNIYNCPKIIKTPKNLYNQNMRNNYLSRQEKINRSRMLLILDILEHEIAQDRPLNQRSSLAHFNALAESRGLKGIKDKTYRNTLKAMNEIEAIQTIAKPLGEGKGSSWHVIVTDQSRKIINSYFLSLAYSRSRESCTDFTALYIYKYNNQSLSKNGDNIAGCAPLPKKGCAPAHVEKQSKEQENHLKFLKQIRDRNLKESIRTRGSLKMRVLLQKGKTKEEIEYANRIYLRDKQKRINRYKVKMRYDSLISSLCVDRKSFSFPWLSA